MKYCELEDFRKKYHQMTPKMFVDYCESGSWTMQTLRENVEDFQKLRFKQRVAVDIESRQISTELFGQEITQPVIGAPVGLLGMQRADGEIRVAKAFAKKGVPFTLSTMSICSIEDVANESSEPFWFQLYVQKDKEFTRKLIRRAEYAECSALVVTLDLQMLGKRHADIRNGMTAPPRLTVKNMLNIATKPRWAFEMLATKRKGFDNIQGHVDGVDGMGDLMKWTKDSFDLKLNWDDIKLFRELWKKPLVLKGIMTIEDAVEAVRVGAEAIVVSNHGGRQLDGTRSSISVLSDIVAEVGDKVDVLLDSGVRSGQDVLRARACGAKAVMIGRPIAYALGAGGQKAVENMLDIFAEELEVTMAFCGHNNINQVDNSILYSETKKTKL